jgi:hypothetical protein
MTERMLSLEPAEHGARSRGAAGLPVAGLVLLTLLGGCAEDRLGRACTSDYRYFTVQVTAPSHLVIDSVTVENDNLRKCEHSNGLVTPREGGGAYHCGEQGAGEYVIRVHAGEKTWTQTVDIASDGCHIKGVDELVFDLTGEERDCTTDLQRFPVEVTSPEGLTVDRVTAENGVVEECAPSATAVSYDCDEQGAGEYVVRVYSGARTWTQTVELTHDGCHIRQPSEPVTFALSAASADPHECSAELRAIRVELSSPEGLVVDSVTIENEHEQPCEEATPDALAYDCHEQGGGEYIVRVHSGELTWTQTLEITHDGCHIPEGESVSFDLTAASADD